MKKVYLVECLTPESWEIDSVHSSTERAMAHYPGEVWQAVSERNDSSLILTAGWNNGKPYEEALVILELKVDTEKEELLLISLMLAGLWPWPTVP